ncbi:MAG: glycosyltransferase, partial [Planctomycetaceae bacterium]|nr:glycosyltransferase [Planctomycetaceae bacterium]
MSSATGNPQEFPLVSVVMGVYNAGNYLDAAVRSILEQEYPNFEFIVIDDGSTDDSFAKLQRYVVEFPQLRLIQQQNRGPAAARNTGIKAAVGKYIAIMDADDVSDRMRLRQQVKFLETHPECMAVGSHLEMIDPDGETIAGESGRPTEHEEILKFMMTGLGGIPNPAAMIRGDILKQVGGYDEEFPAAEDLDLWFRLSEHGQLANLPEALHQYRLHESAHGTTKLNLQNEWGKRAVLSYF